LDNARRNLKEKKDGLKKTEQSYKKDEATYETLKKTISKLEVMQSVFLSLFKNTLFQLPLH